MCIRDRYINLAWTPQFSAQLLNRNCYRLSRVSWALAQILFLLSKCISLATFHVLCGHLSAIKILIYQVEQTSGAGKDISCPALRCFVFVFSGVNVSQWCTGLVVLNWFGSDTMNAILDICCSFEVSQIWTHFTSLPFPFPAPFPHILLGGLGVL